jgi:hypothetical protein
MSCSIWDLCLLLKVTLSLAVAERFGHARIGFSKAGTNSNERT